MQIKFIQAVLMERRRHPVWRGIHVQQQIIMQGHHVAISVRVMKSVMQTGKQQRNPERDMIIQQRICAEQHVTII